MTSVRSSTAKLARLFAESPFSVSVANQDREIVFVNEACAAWMGVPADQLVGERCDYHSSSERDGVGRAAAALCPPPEVFSGEAAVAEVSSPNPACPEPVRQIEFVPIGNTPSSCVGVMALERDSKRTTDELEVDWPRLLHAKLAEFCAVHNSRFSLGQLAGDSPARRRVRKQVELAALSRASVLISGPLGSGRQHVARTIHALSGGDSRITPLDCAVAPQGLVEHTLAKGQHDSHAEHHGTLLLVGVDQLAVDAQAALAQQLAMSDGASFRTLSTATDCLTTLAEQGRFREDLAYELSDLTIELPPLCELSDDIPLLAQWFVEAENSRGMRQLSGFTDAAMEVLLSYHWPGNVDELSEVVRDAHRESGQLRISEHDLPQRLRLAADAAIQGAGNATIDLEAYLADVELRLVRDALAATEGNKSQAAKRLGMTRQRFYRRLVQLGLEEPE